MYTYRESAAPKAALVEELGAEYIGAASCLMCHEGYKEKYLGTLHALSLGEKYAPPSDTGCAACHDPHGSANHAQLKISGNGLCLQCHTDRTNHKPGRTCWTAGCHSQVHGSNQNSLLLR